MIDSEIDEGRLKDEKPLHYVRRIAREKWMAASQKGGGKTNILLAADTTVYCGSKIFGKASSAREAARFLHSLSGRTHFVATAVALGRALGMGQKFKPKVFVVISRVRFRKLSPAEINSYIASGEWKGKAGAYAIQGRAAGFVETITGSLTNIIGLPLAETLGAIRKPLKREL